MVTWVKSNWQTIKAVLWRPWVAIVIAIYALLEFISNIIAWTQPPDVQAKYQYIVLINWYVWVIGTPILTAILIALIIYRACTVVNERDEESAKEIEKLRKSLEEEQAKNARPELQGKIQHFTVSPIFSYVENNNGESGTLTRPIRKTGFEIILNVRFRNTRPAPTTIKNFRFELKQNFTKYTAVYAEEEEIRREVSGKLTDEKLNNLASLLVSSTPIEKRAVEGFLRFRFENCFVHTQHIKGNQLTLAIIDDFDGEHVLTYEEQEFVRPSQRAIL